VEEVSHGLLEPNPLSQFRLMPALIRVLTLPCQRRRAEDTSLVVVAVAVARVCFI